MKMILRMVELDGKAEPNVQVKFAAPIASAREVNGQELPVGPATVSGRRAGKHRSRLISRARSR